MKNSLGRLFSRPTQSEQLQQWGVRADLVRAVAQTAFGRQTERDLLALDGVLDRDEAVLRLLEGRTARSVGLLTLTSRRLVFLPKGGRTPLEFALSDIRSATATRRRGMGVLVVATSDGELVVDQILGLQAGWMSDDITAARSEPARGPVPARDPLEELAELRTLHAGGIVDDAEYDQRKRDLFRRL